MYGLVLVVFFLHLATPHTINRRSTEDVVMVIPEKSDNKTLGDKIIDNVKIGAKKVQEGFEKAVSSTKAGITSGYNFLKDKLTPAADSSETVTTTTTVSSVSKHSISRRATDEAPKDDKSVGDVIADGFSKAKEGITSGFNFLKSKLTPARDADAATTSTAIPTSTGVQTTSTAIPPSTTGVHSSSSKSADAEKTTSTAVPTTSASSAVARSVSDGKTTSTAIPTSTGVQTTSTAIPTSTGVQTTSTAVPESKDIAIGGDAPKQKDGAAVDGDAEATEDEEGVFNRGLFGAPSNCPEGQKFIASSCRTVMQFDANKY